MPPAMSDDDSDGVDNIPAREKPDVPMADDDDDEEGEDEYQVEKILTHRFKGKGRLEYQVKWLGYDDPADLTWEPADNLENAEDAVKAYHLEIGGTPEPPAKGGSSVKAKAKPGKRSASELFDSPAPSGSQKKSRKSQTNGAATEEWEPPVGSWEDHVTRVAAIIEVEEDPAVIKKGKTDIKSLEGLLEWTPKFGERKTQHKMEVLRQKCPQRLLDYYESHLVFKGDPRYRD